MKRKIMELKEKKLGIWFKSFLTTWLNSLLYFCTWIWIILPLFPSLPFVSYWVWLGIEVVRVKIVKSRYIGVVDNSIEFSPEKDKWLIFLLGYGSVFLILWLCSLSVSTASLPDFNFPRISIQVGE